MRAVGEHIWIEKDAARPLEIGGILIPGFLERTPRFSPTVKATVVAIGGKVQSVKAGSRVFVQNHAGDDFFMEGRMLTHLRERDLIGLVL